MSRPKQAGELRRAAEARLEARAQASRRAPTNLSRLTHELQVHQIELDMQNEALQHACAELESALARYTDLYDFAPVGYFTFGARGVILQANLTGARLLGSDRASLLGRRFADFISLDSRAALAGLLARASRGSGREACDIELAGETSSSGRQFVRVEATAGGDGDTVRAAVMDISAVVQVKEALREREATLSSILDATPDFVCTVDRQFRILFANRGPAGWNVDSVWGTDVTAYVAPEHQSLICNCIRQVFETGAVGRLEVIAHAVNDEPLWYEIVAAPVRRDAEIISVTLLARDITARRNANRAMAAAKAEADLANSAKSRFLAAASHDLRQPLSALTVYATVLKHKLAAADQPVLANMKDCIGSLSELLINLLDLSKLEAGVVTPNISDVPLFRILSSLESIHAPEARLKGLRLHCVASRMTVRTDPVLLQRIVGNFVGNAIRYTERGGVLVGCRRRQGKISVEVWDSGIGIPKDKMTEIFEEFKQLGDNARTRGSGLGLAIAAKTAALLGLEIKLRSRPGRGSVFAIELPSGREQAVPALEPIKTGNRSLRIALVDDVDLVRQALDYALQAAGHQVLAVSSGNELRAELASFAPDIVVSDYRC